MLHNERFADLAPAEVWAMLLDEGTYLGSVSTFYRVLRQAGETRERRRQATHPPTVKPELAATAPNQVWSWDITKLHGPGPSGPYYYRGQPPHPAVCGAGCEDTPTGRPVGRMQGPARADRQHANRGGDHGHTRGGQAA